MQRQARLVTLRQPGHRPIRYEWTPQQLQDFGRALETSWLPEGDMSIDVTVGGVSFQIRRESHSSQFSLDVGERAVKELSLEDLLFQVRRHLEKAGVDLEPDYTVQLSLP